METSQRLKNILLLTFLASGTMSLFSAKMQNIQIVQEGGHTKKFFHPYMQSFMMFVGQALCLLIFYVMRAKNPEKYQLEAKKALEEGKPPVPAYWIVVPAVCDFISSGLQYVALNYIPASIYQMLKGGGIITTFLFSYCLLKPIVKRSQISGCLLALIGITLVGLAALIFNPSSSQFSNIDMIIGCVLMISSLVANGFFYSFQQKIFKKYYASPLYMVGMEGIFGLIISAAVITGLTFVPCHFSTNGCVFKPDGSSFIERPEVYFQQLGANPLLLSMVCVTVFSISFFNFIGLSITKYINALARAVLNLTKTALIWIIGIIVTVTAGKTNKMYQWEIVSWQIILLQSIGFTFLIFATLIYNQNIYVPVLSDPRTFDRLEVRSLLTNTEEDVN